MPKTSSAVSIVIPVFNEEDHIRGCLDAIARQTVKPAEVIIVDNNSTDRTVSIARSFPFVTIVSERRQGVVYARDRGYDVAKSEIIARIDGDSRIAPNWVEQIQKTFADPTVQAASGQITYRDVGLARGFNAVDVWIRNYLSRRMGALGEQFLYGVNMAIRRSAWCTVREHVCHEARLHEDLDLAAHLSHAAHKVVFEPAMRVSISPRQAAAGPRQFYGYVWSNSAVFTRHDMKSKRYADRIALLVTSLYIPIHILYRGYNPATRRFSVTYALTNTTPARVSPVSDPL